MFHNPNAAESSTDLQPREPLLKFVGLQTFLVLSAEALFRMATIDLANRQDILGSIEGAMSAMAGYTFVQRLLKFNIGPEFSPSEIIMIQHISDNRTSFSNAPTTDLAKGYLRYCKRNKIQSLTPEARAYDYLSNVIFSRSSGVEKKQKVDGVMQVFFTNGWSNKLV
jgi:hypothetical protein